MADVILELPVDEVSDAAELPSRTYNLDFDTGRIIGYVDGLEAVKQAIRKALVTPRFMCLIYDDQYGSEIRQSVTADDASPDYIMATMENFVRDALSPDARIIDIADFEYEFDGDEAYISFRVSTIFGDTQIEEVL